MFRFPYGNLHGFNLDWLLAEWKKFKDAFTTAFTASVTNLPVSSQPTVDVTYDQDENKFNFDFGIPSEVKPQSFQIGYAESSSGTVIPTGVTWLNNPPSVAPGNYLWSRTMVIYNDGSYSATYACSRMGVDGSGVPATATPLMDGVGAVGVSDNYAREDHVHPSDTSRIATSALSNSTPAMNGTGNSGASTDVSRADHIHPSDTSKLGLNSINNFELSGNSSITIYHSAPVLIFTDRGGMWTEGISQRSLTTIASASDFTVTRVDATHITITSTNAYGTTVTTISREPTSL